MPNAIDMMRTVAWFRECCSEAGVDTAYALEKRFDELAMMDGSGDAMTRSEPRTFSQYADGSVLPSTETLAAVEAVLPSTREVFDMGPKTEDGYAPLWLGVAGDTESILRLLDCYDAEVPRMRVLGCRLRELIDLFTARFFPSELAIDNLEALEDIEKHEFRWLLLNGRLKLGTDLLVVLVILWRLSMDRNEDFVLMEYYMEGIYDTTMETLLEVYGIDYAFAMYCRDLSQFHWSRLRAMADGKPQPLFPAARSGRSRRH